jgi:hypothetical protein
MNSKEIFIKCECHGEGLGIEYDADDQYYYLSMWNHGFNNKILPWKERVRFCWQLLTKGKAFNDELILNQESVDILVSFLNKNRPGYPIGDNIVADME